MAIARSRVIKPEFFSNARIFALGPWPRLLFIGMWCFADDQGVIPCEIHFLRVHVFPEHGFPDGAILEWLAELHNQRLIVPFEVDERKFLLITGWNEHQKPRFPTAKYPAPPRALLEEQMEQQDLFATKASANFRRPTEDLAHMRESRLQYNTIPLVKDSQDKTPSGSKAKKGTRLADDFEMPLDWIADGEAHLAKHKLNGVDVKLEADNFVNYWTSATGQRATKADWRKTWLNWLVRASEMAATGRSRPKIDFDKL